MSSKKGKPSAIDDDERFKEIKTQPRFMPMGKKNKKVKVLDKGRFKQMFAADKSKGKDDDFDVVAQYDRQGNLVKKRDKLIEKFYDLDDDEKPKKNKDAGSDDEEKKDAKTKFYDEEGNFQWQGADSSSSDDGSAGE